MNRITNFIVVSLLAMAAPAWAQEPEGTPPATPDAEAPPVEAEATPTPEPVSEPMPEPEPEPEPEPMPAAEPMPQVEQKATVGDNEPIYRKGGLAGLGIVVAPKIGFGFGLSEFGSTPVFELEVGWIVLPFPDLQIFTSLQYVNPKQEGGGTDARLPGDGSWTYLLDQKSLVLTPGLLYRIPVGGEWFRPYLAAGPRFYFNKTTVQGYSGAEAFGEYEEKGSSIGFYGSLGGDLFVGPGSILLELQFGTSKVDQYVLQDTNNSALNIALGYRFYF